MGQQLVSCRSEEEDLTEPGAVTSCIGKLQVSKILTQVQSNHSWHEMNLIGDGLQFFAHIPYSVLYFHFIA